MNTVVILIILLVICLLVLFLLSKYNNKKNGNILDVHKNAIYNGKDTNPSISTINNVGFNLYGNFRIDLNGSCVKYLFFSLLIPLFPIGCYRVKEGKTEYLGRQGVESVSKTKYTIYGTEKWNSIEVLIIYMIVIAALLVLLIIIFSWDYIF